MDATHQCKDVIPIDLRGLWFAEFTLKVNASHKLLETVDGNHLLELIKAQRHLHYGSSINWFSNIRTMPGNFVH